MRCAALVLLLSLGCGASPKARPVSGTLFVDGRPAAGATVFLHPTGSQDGKPILPSGRVEADGSFRVSTFGHQDGAPPGDYAVTVVWPHVSQQGGETVEGNDRLADRYRDPARPAARFAVREGDNVIPALQLRTR